MTLAALATESLILTLRQEMPIYQLKVSNVGHYWPVLEVAFVE
jgi:hypothetical protein